MGTPNEKTKRRELGSVVPTREAEPKADVQVHGLVVPTSPREQTKRTDGAPPRLRVSKYERESERFVKRIKKLRMNGIKLTQLAEVVGLSYSGLYRMVLIRNIVPAEDKLPAYHAALDKWCKTIGSC